MKVDGKKQVDSDTLKQPIGSCTGDRLAVIIGISAVMINCKEVPHYIVSEPLGQVPDLSIVQKLEFQTSFGTLIWTGPPE